ncbi:MAG: hypothetical protein ACOCV3_02555 [Halanaerobiales bacterium]
MTSYVIGSLAAILGNRLGIGIPALNGIIVAALAMPFVESIFKNMGYSQMPELNDKELI